MENFVIMTDSCCDLPADIVEKMGIDVVPMAMMFSGNSYKHYNDFRELSAADYYDALRNGATGSTSGTNIQDAADMMEVHLREGKDIIYLSLSSGLSCSYQNACLAADEMRDAYPDRRIEVVDTRSVCGGVGMLVYLAAREKNKGLSYNEVLQCVNKYAPAVHHYFAVDDLSCLRRSGRISHLSSVVGGVLGVKPIFTLDANGKVQTVDKVRGRKVCVKNLIKRTLDDVRYPEIMAVCHADAEEDALVIKDELEKAYPGVTILTCNIGPIIGINTGIGTLAIMCFGEPRARV